MENMGEWAKRKRKAIFASGIGILSFIITVFSVVVTQWSLIARIIAAVVAGLVLLAGVVLSWYIVKERVCGYLQKFEEIYNLLKGDGEEKEPCYQNCHANLSEINMYIKEMKEVHEKVTENLDCIKKDVSRKSYFRYNSSKTTTTLLELLRAHKDVEELKIICYGRKGYEAVVETIHREELRVKVKMIVCNPEENKDICEEGDKKDILKEIKRLLRYGEEIEIFGASVPPAIRASVVYDRDNQPIWGTVQAYRFIREKGVLKVEKPEDSLIIMCDKDDDEKDFEGMIKYFEEEYQRLWECSQKAVMLGKKVGFIGKIKEEGEK
ncbi:hypothetical protein E5329_22570 [Petralouisia muris]|uniref:Uncharacterized protein n=1 Tax=Petralouisia muris TaxID=3032872 RepID=A0AC61RRN9_9FIRM|nr:TMEM198/TM7SF3 family protein [Petralouisia muris]TGY91155.1 hypothetical protein E5329_22570 [Petralouisia muris]